MVLIFIGFAYPVRGIAISDPGAESKAAVASQAREETEVKTVTSVLELAGARRMMRNHARYVQVSLREVIPGRGDIDYPAYLEGLSHLTTDALLMPEHLKTSEEYAEGRNTSKG